MNAQHCILDNIPTILLIIDFSLPYITNCVLQGAVESKEMQHFVVLFSIMQSKHDTSVLITLPIHIFYYLSNGKRHCLAEWEKSEKISSEHQTVVEKMFSP